METKMATNSDALQAEEVNSARIALLARYLPPHQTVVYQAYARQFQRLSILLSTAMERHRNWEADWGDLEIHLQKNFTFRQSWKHRIGFSDYVDVHIPWDTLSCLRKLKPDVVISCEFGFRSLAAVMYRNLYRRVPLVLWACVSDHTEKNRGLLRGGLRRYLVRQADAVIVNGAGGRRYVEGLGVAPERVFEIPYATTIEPHERALCDRSPEAAHRLVCVGQLIERKGVREFLEALVAWANRHPERPIEMRLVGDGPLRAELESLATPSNLALQFDGWKTHEQLREIYATSGILVFPTLADEWGLVANEGMSNGLPVLGSRYSQAVEELCVEGETGWTFAVDDPDELDKAIGNALNASADELNQMRGVCQQRALKLSPQLCADRLRRLVERLLGQRAEENRASGK